MKKFVDLTVILTALTAAISVFFYTCSVAYYGGYQDVFELDSDLLHRNTEKIIYNGFFLNFGGVMNFLLVTSVICFFFGALLFVFISKKYKPFNNVKHTPIKWCIVKVNDISLGKYNIFVLPLFISIFLLMYIFCLRSFEISGREYATSVKSDLTNGRLGTHHHVIPHNMKEKKAELYKVMCGADLCAAYDIKSKRYYYYDPKNVFIEMGRVKDPSK